MDLGQIKSYNELKKAQIYQSFKEAGDNGRAATLITKAEFEEKFTKESHEVFSLMAVNTFREDILKADDISDKDGAFKEATKDLKSFIVQSDKDRAIVFVREKKSAS